MANHQQLVDIVDDIELAEIQRISFNSSFRHNNSSTRRSSKKVNEHDDDPDVQYALQWAAIQRLPTFKRLTTSLFDEDSGNTKKLVDVSKLDALDRRTFVEKLIKHIENDNLALLRKVRNRIDRVGLQLPTIEVRYENVFIEADCKVVHGKPLPTLWNSIRTSLDVFEKLPGVKSQRAKLSIINGVSGVLKPGRMTLLLGPPGCGKTSFLKALSGNLCKSLKVNGKISYNGYKLEEFVPQKSSAYISQDDLHIPEMTVRETLDFSAYCQGVGSHADIIGEIMKREKEAGIVPDPDIDAYMKAISANGKKGAIQTDYIIKILGLGICADTMVGDNMRRGISGGQKKRLTTGEMIVGPAKVLFMDEITNGLDSSTAFQIVSCMQHLAHISDSTILITLLQPAPETFELFDDIIIMAEGKILYHGPRDCVLQFFEDCGFRCPKRKAVADFLQEVISKKDQAQYWFPEQPHSYVTVDMFCRQFKESSVGTMVEDDLSKPYDKSKGHKDALSFDVYSFSKWELFKACMSREFLLAKRNYHIYISKSAQIVFVAVVTMTVFLHSRLPIDVVHSNSYMSVLFFGLLIAVADGIPELSLTVHRLPGFYKQKDLYFYPAWAYAIPSAIVKIPLSFVQTFVWTCLTYYVIGFSPGASRFFKQFLLLFSVHLSSISMFRLLAALCQNVAAALTAGSFAVLAVLVFGGFIISHSSMPGWLKWAFWVNPVSYAEIGFSENEFLAPRWQKKSSLNTTTIGDQVLQARGLDFDENLLWICVGALFAFALLLNVMYTLTLTFMKFRSSSRVISQAKLSHFQGSKISQAKTQLQETTKIPSQEKTGTNTGKMVLPFQPLTIAFQNVQYYIDTPVEMKEQGYGKDKLQILCDITGSFKPGVLTALMGVSGAGKTTLLDVLAGRKTTGYIEGDIKVGGYPKVQTSFARISGYCEQTDIHSPQLTVEESVIFSAWMRLDSQTDSKTKLEFVNEVLETIELDVIKDALVGIPGLSGLSNEQRKRLTIAVELVANPSIIFMDEPTTGLDARSAAIVMRGVKNVADTGRTIVCTIHQPSIDIFEAFDELILLKNGGRVIYSGPLGQHSSRVVEYFEGISGIPKIRKNYNPATWMLDVTSTSAEADLGLDFAEIYRDSTLYLQNKEVVDQLSRPPPGSRDLNFPTIFSQNVWGQFKSCLWKQSVSYWRSPPYNLSRIIYVFAVSLLFGVLFWNQGKKINNQQGLFNVAGSMYSAVLFIGINNLVSIFPYVSMERNVMYREQFAGMYSSWAFSFGQVAIEIPYVFIQAATYVIITYPMIGFYGSAYKIFWYFYSMFSNMLIFNYLGMMLVSLTPNVLIASILASPFIAVFNLFSGFVVPSPQIPKWWIWLYYMSPTSWVINGMLNSQYGDINDKMSAFGETKSVAEFLQDYYGFHHDRLPITAVLLILFPLALASLFSYFIGHLNFQRR